MRIRLFTALAVFLLAAAFGAPAMAQAGPTAAPTTRIETAPLPPAGVAHFDVQKAVDAYMSRVSGEQRAKSDAYFEGGYTLLGVDTLYTLVVSAILLWFGLSAAMRNFAVRLSQSGFGRLLVYTLLFLLFLAPLIPLASVLRNHANPLLLAALVSAALVLILRTSGWVRDVVEKFAASRFMQAPIYAVQYLVITAIVTLPLTIYEGFYREREYGLMNQNFAQWFGDFGKNFLIQLVIFTVLLTIIYAIVRATKRYWWMWGAAITVIFMVVVVTISPVYLAPVFNDYTALPDSGTKNAILSMARANGVPADNVYTFDASKQSKRISANVSGMLGTTRISLNDNLLNRCTPSEVLAVLGHEIGHYVLGHVNSLIIQFGLLILVAFFLVDRSFRFLSSIFGGNWGAREIDDPAGLPVLLALLSFYLLLATPVTNTIIRTNEIQADIFGLNAVRQPDAFATTALKLSEYRKLDPSPLEEIVFYDHPSGRTRIFEAMRWKKEHLNDPDIMAGPISPQ